MSRYDSIEAIQNDDELQQAKNSNSDDIQQHPNDDQIIQKLIYDHNLSEIIEPYSIIDVDS